MWVERDWRERTGGVEGEIDSEEIERTVEHQEVEERLKP